MPIAATIATANNLRESLLNGPAAQFVTGLAITPGPNSATFAFKTRFASSPTIEIFKYISGDSSKDFAPENLVSNNLSQTSGVPRKKTHNYRLPRPADWTPDSFPGLDDPFLLPLKQDTHYWFKITADSALKNVTPATVIGHFFTGKRDVSVTIEELIVYRYGSSDIGNAVDDAVNSVAGFFGADPPNPTDYRLDLAIAVFDQVNGLTDQVEKIFKSANNNDDLRNPFPDRSLQCSAADDFLWLYSYGGGNQGAWNVGAPFSGPAEVLGSPPIVPNHGDSQTGPWAEAVAMSSRLPDTLLELQSLPSGGQFPMLAMALDSGNWGTAYEIIAWLNVTLTPPRHAPVIHKLLDRPALTGLQSRMMEKLKGPKMRRLLASSEGVMAFGTPQKLHVLVPGAGLSLWAQTRQTEQRQPNTNPLWSKLGEGINVPIAVLENDDGVMDIIARGTDGNAWHTRWDGSDASAARTKWRNLGQEMSEEIALVRQTDGLDIFILNQDGAIVHGRVSGNGKASVWKSLGGNIGSELKAVPMADGDVHLIGVGRKGDVWHNVFNHSHSSGSKTGWNSLGESSIIQLSALSDEKQDLVVFAIGVDRTLYRKSWNGKDWSPAKHEWKSLGPLDSLAEPSPPQK